MNAKSFRFLSLLLCVLMLFSACAHLPDLDYENGVYTYWKTGVSYTLAPMNYEAISYSEKAAFAKLAEGGDVKVYPINGVEMSKLLCTENYEVLCATNYTIPEIWDVKVSKLHICKTIEISYALANVTDAADLRALMEIYGGVSFSSNEIDAGLTKEKYDLKLESPDLQGLYYCLTYWRFNKDVLVYEDLDDPDSYRPKFAGVDMEIFPYESGGYYAEYNFGTEILYDRSTGSCYALGDLLASYLEESESGTVE